MKTTKKQKTTIVSGDTAETLMIEALYYMKLRTGWEFPEPLEELLIDIAKNDGFNISNGLGNIDNAYINGEWGEIEELNFNDEEDKEQFLQNCLWYDDTYYVKHF